MNLNFEDIERLFPPGTKIIDFVGTPGKYKALVRSKCKTKEEFRRNWLKQYEELSRVTLRVLLTRPSVGKIVVYKAAFRCQHNTYPKSHHRVKAPHKKHTGCPAVVRVTIKAPTENRRVRSKDTLRAEYPTVININHNHNHHLPSTALAYNEAFDTYGKSIENVPLIDYETLMESSVKSELKKDIVESEEELNWDNLRNRWNLLFRKWDLTNSAPLYRALLKATTFIEGFETVNGTINALNSLGKRLRTKKLEPVSIREQKLYCGDVKIEADEANYLENSTEVDELLVIDHGWIS